MNDFDVIIVGARIAGATLAGFLSHLGVQVLLVDRATFPSDTVSCAVAYAKALALWDVIGVGGKIDAIGAPPIRHVRKQGPGNTVLAGYLLPYAGRNYGYGLRRITLDEILVRHVARMPGVTLREEFSVSGLLQENGRVIGIEGRTRDGKTEQFRTPLVVGADGVFSSVARWVQAETYLALPAAQCHYYAFYHRFDPVAEPELFIHQDSPDQSVLVFEVDGDEDGDLMAVSWMPSADRFEMVKKDVETSYVAAWQSIPELAERGRNAQRATRIMGRAPNDVYMRKPHGPGWALVGDSAFLSDPNGGRGFYDGLRSAELLAHAIDHIRRGRPWEEAMRTYHFARDYEFEPSFRFVRGLSTRSMQRPSEELHLWALAGEDPAFADTLLSVNHGVDVARFVGTPPLPFTIPD